MVLGQVLFPVWFFQGMERMKYITFLNILAKPIFIIAIFIFVKRLSEYLYVPPWDSSGFILAGILALFLHVNNYLLQKIFLKGGI
jgi:PST family polysaccharide transporter